MCLLSLYTNSNVFAEKFTDFFLSYPKFFHASVSWFPQKYWAQLYSKLVIIIHVSWAANQHIRMISEGSCDTVDWSNGQWLLKIQLFHNRNKLIWKYINIENSYFILQWYFTTLLFYCISSNACRLCLHKKSNYSKPIAVYIRVYLWNWKPKTFHSLADSVWWHPQVCKRATQTDASIESSQPHSAYIVAGWFFGQAYWGSWPQVGEGWQQVEAPGQGMWLRTYCSVKGKNLLEWRLYVS